MVFLRNQHSKSEKGYMKMRSESNITSHKGKKFQQNAKWMKVGIWETVLFSEPDQGRTTVETEYLPGVVVRGKISQYTGGFKKESYSSLLQTVQFFPAKSSIVPLLHSQRSHSLDVKLYGQSTFKLPLLVWHGFPLLSEQHLMFFVSLP